MADPLSTEHDASLPQGRLELPQSGLELLQMNVLNQQRLLPNYKQPRKDLRG